MKDVMIDLETFSTKPNAAIVQIGACYFNRVTGEVGKTFKVNISPRDAVAFGADIDPDTVAWWMKQSDAARESVLKESGVSLKDALESFNLFLQGAKNVWSHATFDFPIVMNNFSMAGIKPKVSYRAARDIRTLTNLAGNSDVSKHERVGTHHDALDDCLFQVKYCVAALNSLKKGA